MRYFNIMMDSSATGHANMVICTLNDLVATDELTRLLRACTRTFMHLWEVNGKLTALERPYFHYEEDLNPDEDCGAFRLETLVQWNNINQMLAVILDSEIDKFIKDKDLWSKGRIKDEKEPVQV